VLWSGTMGPASCVLRAGGADRALVADGDGAVAVEPGEVQAVTASRAAAPMVSAAAVA